MTSQELANKMIQELVEAGFTYDEMIKIFRLAGKHYKTLPMKSPCDHKTVIHIRHAVKCNDCGTVIETDC